MSTEERRIQIAMEEATRAGVVRRGGLPIHVDVVARDDCAVVEISPEVDLVFGSDFVRGTGFYLFTEGILNYEDIGWYLVAANISDLAAMGARPSGVVIALRYSSGLGEEEWRMLLRGVCEACHEFDTALLGGDSGGYSADVLSAAAIGTVRRGRALLRSAGRPGDRLFLTGTVGAAGAAVAYFYRGRHQGARVSPNTEKRLLDAWRRVRPAVEQGAWLAENGYSSCALDTSDGLKAGLLEICARSRVDVIVEPSAVPIDPSVREVADAMGLSAMELAMSDSVDFRLLFSVPNSHVSVVEEGFAERGWPLHEVGFLKEADSTPKVTAKGKDGDEEVPGLAWDQSDAATVDRLSRKS